MTDEEIDAEAHAPIIRDRAEQLHNEVHEADSLDDTKFDCWGARAILHLTELEADRPAEDAPDHEHDAYAHERAALMASTASELLSAGCRGLGVDTMTRHGPERDDQPSTLRGT